MKTSEMRASAESLTRDFNVSRESLSRLEVYVELLKQWQKHFNLIGPATVEQIWSRHVADSLQLSTYISGEKPSVADLGSGAGFPGLVLAIATNAQLSLFESNGKKIGFLREAVRKTGIKCTIHQIRLENLPNLERQRYDYVTARALAPLDKLLSWAEPILSNGAVGLFHKGQDVDKELTQAAKSWNMQAIKHPSLVDSTGVILEVKELSRVSGC